MRGQHDPRLEHLRLEGEPDVDAGEDQRAQTARHVGVGRRVRREDEQEDEQRVGDVAPVEEDGDRCDGECGGGDEPGAGAGHAAHGAVEDEHGERALDDLGQDHGPDVEAEEAEGERLDPERARGACRRTPCPMGRRRRRRSCASSRTCCARRRRRTSRGDRGSCPTRTRARRVRRSRAGSGGPTSAGPVGNSRSGGGYDRAAAGFSVRGRDRTRSVSGRASAGAPRASNPPQLPP